MNGGIEHLNQIFSHFWRRLRGDPGDNAVFIKLYCSSGVGRLSPVYRYRSTSVMKEPREKGASLRSGIGEGELIDEDGRSGGETIWICRAARIRGRS